jgi:hypothetical protein
MFQAVPPSIVRSSKLYTQHWVFVELFLILTAIVSELELKFINTKENLLTPNRQKEHTNIETSKENNIKQTQQSGTIKCAGTNR